MVYKTILKCCIRGLGPRLGVEDELRRRTRQAIFLQFFFQICLKCCIRGLTKHPAYSRFRFQTLFLKRCVRGLLGPRLDVEFGALFAIKDPQPERLEKWMCTARALAFAPWGLLSAREIRFGARDLIWRAGFDLARGI